MHAIADQILDFITLITYDCRISSNTIPTTVHA